MSKFKESIQKLRKRLESFDFKVGDKVKIIGEVDGKGKIGKVEDIASQGEFYLININGKKAYYQQTDLKFLNREALAQQFNKGAKVKTAEGFSGIVTKTSYDNDKILYWVNNQGPFIEKELMRG